MPDEFMKSFLEKVAECVDDVSAALQLLLQYYNVTVAESEFIEEDNNERGKYDGEEK